MKIRDFQARNFIVRRQNKIANYDIIGNITIMKFNGEKKKEKLRQARQLLKRKNIKTVLEKTGKVRGRLRTIKTKFLAGEHVKETIHKENNCRLRLNVETCYFSPKLSEERKEIAGKIRKKDDVLVMFAGVGPFAVVIAKKASRVVAIELSRQCNKYARENIKLNKLHNLELIQGDVKKKVKGLGKFEHVVMPRPNLKETFLKQAFLASKKNTMVYYYCFGKQDKLGKLIEEVYKKSRESKKKIKVLKVKKAGDIAPYKHRYRVDFKVLN